MTIVIIIAISFFVVVGVVLGAYLLIMKKKEHHLEGDTKMDALTQAPVQDQNMFSQPLPQENNPLMGDMTQDAGSIPASSQVMNDIVAPGTSAPVAPVSDFSSVQPAVTQEETQPEETVTPVSMDQVVPMQESPAAEAPAESTPLNLGSTPDFPSFNAEPAGTPVATPEVQDAESPEAAQPESALADNMTPSLDDVPLPPMENVSPQSEESSATEVETVQSEEVPQDVPQESTLGTEGVQIPVNQSVEPQAPVAPIVEEAPTGIPTEGTEEAGKSSTMADLSRGLNISQPTIDKTGEGTSEPPVQDI